MSHDKDYIVVGLTGQTGAGKTTVSEIFAENGFTQIDADKLSKEVMRADSPCLEEVFDYFGDDIRNEDGSLNRKALAKIVFNDKGKLESLNSICHPFITEEIFSRISHYTANGHRMILIDAPTLFESKASDFCDLIISVIAPPELRQKRIIERDHITEQQAQERMNAQLQEDFFINHSDFVIRNHEDLAHLKALSKEVADKIKVYYHTNYHIS